MRQRLGPADAHMPDHTVKELGIDVDVAYLMRGMHARVRPAGHDQTPHRFRIGTVPIGMAASIGKAAAGGTIVTTYPQDGRQTVLECSLDRRHARLRRPSVESGAVISQLDFDSH